ncbi:MAG: alpha/beta hydrolase [Sandaracinaceae bacterium]|nr:alpha/beta hydrolase [Sandaracinaceae bacterium]
MPLPESLRAYDDPNAFERIFVHVGGLRFSLRVAGEPNAEALALCLHGFPESSYSWRYQMPLLAKLGYRVWAPDLRGYGDSDKPNRVEDYRLEFLLEDIAGLVDQASAKRLILVGHDWGGYLAWQFAIRRIRPLERLIVMNIPHPRRMAEGLRRSPKQLLRSWYMFAFQIPRLPEWWLSRNNHEAIRKAFLGMAIDKSRFPPHVLDEFVRSASQPGALFGMLAYYRASFRYPHRTPRRVLELPTLLLWGEEDRALGKELTHNTHELVRPLTLRFIPNCSHWVQQEAPEVVNAMIEDWLEGRRVRHASEIARG